MAPLQELPDGYSEVRRTILTEGNLLLWLNIGALIPMALALVAMALWWVVAAAINPAPSDGGGDTPWILGAVLAIVIVLPLHELIHGIAIALVGHKARYGFKLDKGVLYATADQALFRKREYMLVALAPIVVITVLGMALMLIVPWGWAYFVALGVIINAGGAIGDLWMAYMLARYPRTALVRDLEDGFVIYTPSV